MRRISIPVLLLMLAIPHWLLADDLGILAFPFLFWPLELILSIILIVFSAYSGLSLKGGQHGKSSLIAGVVILFFSTLFGSLFPWLVSLNVSGQRHPGIIPITIMPVIALSAVSVILSLLLVVYSIKNIKQKSDGTNPS